MQLTPAQTIIASDLHRFRVLVCGRKFGKTSISSEEVIGAAIAKKDQRVMYMGPTLTDARRLMWDRLKTKLERNIIKANDSRLELTVGAVGGGVSKIFLGSWELVQNYRGDEFNFLVLDEVQEYRNFFLGWQEALRPTLTPRQGTALFLGTPKGFNHLYDLYNWEGQDTAFKSFKFSSLDNPFLPQDEIDAARRQMTEDRFAQEYLADFRKTEGLVYKEFDRNIHLFDYNTLTQEQLIGDSLLLGGIDFGFTNPAAVLHIRKDRKGTFWVTDEWYKTGQTDAQVAEFTASCGFVKVFPDPESPAAIKELKTRNVSVGEVNKGRDSIQAGINVVRELLKNKQLRIHRKCVNTIWEFETYAYPDKVDKHSAPENPIDEGNHALSAIRYTVTSQTSGIRFAHTYIPTGISGTSTAKVATIYIPPSMK
jgi:hypothetical protein